MSDLRRKVAISIAGQDIWDKIQTTLTYKTSVFTDEQFMASRAKARYLTQAQAAIDTMATALLSEDMVVQASKDLAGWEYTVNGLETLVPYKEQEYIDKDYIKWLGTSKTVLTTAAERLK